MAYDSFRDVHNLTSESVGYNEEQISGSVKGTRLEKYCDDGRAQSHSSARSPSGLPNIPVVQDEFRDNHERKKDIGDRKSVV